MEQKRDAQLNKNQEARLLRLLLILLTAILLVVVLIAVLLIQNLNFSPKPEATTTTSGQTPPETPPPGDTRPVFAGGIVPTMPAPTATTVTLSEEIKSQFAILIDSETGEILAGKDYDTRFSPASMTKVMTLIVACERLTMQDLDRMLVFDEEIYSYVTSGNYSGTSSSLPTESKGVSCIGDRYRIEDLLYGIGVASAADCTYMIVKAVAGTEEAFVAMMNQKATEMGLVNTHFNNAVGFDSEENYTTAKEMAMIMAYAMQSERISTYLSKTEDYPIFAHYDKDGADATYRVTLKCSWNSRLDKYPEFALTTTRLMATKTGYTNQSFMVAGAESLSGQGKYVMVLGNHTSSATTITEKFRQTMIDMELLLNTYVTTS